MQAEVYHLYSRAQVGRTEILNYFVTSETVDATASRVLAGTHPDYIYCPVAVLDMDHPAFHRDNNPCDVAYQMTNSVHDHWAKNVGVRALLPRCRSTSIGDMIVMLGKRYVVMPCGFTEITL